MGVKLSGLRLDSEAVVNGRWFQWVPGVRLKLAKWGNDRFQERLEELFKDLGKADEDVLKQVAAETVLLDVEGLDDDDGNPISYTSELGLEWLRDPELLGMWSFVKERSVADEAFRRRALGN